MFNSFFNNIINVNGFLNNMFNRNLNFFFDNFLIRNRSFNDIFYIYRSFNNNINIFINWNFYWNFNFFMNNSFNRYWSFNIMRNSFFNDMFLRNLNNSLNRDWYFFDNDIIIINWLINFLFFVNIFDFSWENFSVMISTNISFININNILSPYNIFS